MQDLLDPAIEPLDHAVGLRMLRRGQAVFDAEVVADTVELVLAGGAALAQTEQSAGELAAIIRDMVLIRIGQARSRSRRNRQAFAAVLQS